MFTAEQKSDLFNSCVFGNVYFLFSLRVSKKRLMDALCRLTFSYNPIRTIRFLAILD